MTNPYLNDLEEIKKQFAELCEFKKLNKKIYFQVLSGRYKDSIFKATNISEEYLSVQAIVFNIFATKLSFKFYEIEFLPGEEIIQQLTINNSEKSNMLVDKLKNKIKVGDFIAFTSSVYKKSDNLQFGEITEIYSNKKIIVKTIPQIRGEKSITLRLRYRRNFLKLNEEQINNLVFNKLSK